MGLFDRLFGSDDSGSATETPRRPRTEDDVAVERYRYLLRTAPPEAIEQVHAEAFERLTPEQRRLVFESLSESAPAAEKPLGADATSLARAATRSELRHPGTLERSFGGQSFGSTLASSLLGTVAGYVIGSAIVSSFLPDPGLPAADSSQDAAQDDSGDDSADSGFDSGGDFGADFGGGDFGF